MKQKSIVALLIIVLFTQLLPLQSHALTQQSLRGVWVASVLNLDYPTSATTDPEALKAEAIEILDRAQQVGFNAVYLQVRPTADALYKSDVFPWSKYLTGREALPPDGDFDPLSFWVEQAHARGIELHAWLNPYRITKRKDGEPAYTPEMLTANHPARLHPDWVVTHEGNLYFDPALPQVQDLIVQGVTEIIENYDVDGIHFDDYFYPGTDFNDDDSYAIYGKGLVRDDWRRANVNAMVRAVYNAVKQYQGVQFGISPFGIWANKDSLENGSATKGNQSYFAHYADSLAWIDEGIIDYIAPQIYWHIGFDIADYITLVDWWVEQTRGKGVDLIIGQAAYRLGNNNPKSPWYGNDQLFRQLAYNMTQPEIAGSIYFRDGDFKESIALAERLKTFYKMLDTGDYYHNLSVNFPIDHSATRADKTYISGYADPLKPLYINGQLIHYRTPKGFFGTQVAISSGKNEFSISQDGEQQTIVIYRGKTPTGISSEALGGGNQFQPDEPVQPVEKVLVADSLRPQGQQLRAPGEEITLACQAPIGATVSVTFNDETIELTPKTTQKYGSKVLTTFSAGYQLPYLEEGETSRMLDAPVYHMKYTGKTDVKMAPANYTVTTDTSNYYARVVKDHIDTYFVPDPSEGSDYILEKGMVDGVLKLTDKYVQLASGRWTYRKNVSIFYQIDSQFNQVHSASYQQGDRFDYIDVKMSRPAAVSLQLEDGILAAEFANTTYLPELQNSAPSLIDTASANVEGNRATYYFSFNDFSQLHGYYTEKTVDGVRIYLKKAPQISDGARPLTGLTIMIDPGHGGKDSGAIGVMGRQFSEKHINLETSNALKNELEALGANVVMTRYDDQFFSLQDRLRMSLAIKPDLFISMHADSINADHHLSFVRGFSAHYQHEIAAKLAYAVHDNVIDKLQRYDRKVRVNNFYVVRGTWAPSFLLEAGFVPNPMEFELMTTPALQRQYAATIAEGIVDFFRR